jgi:hypothetical protein
MQGLRWSRHLHMPLSAPEKARVRVGNLNQRAHSACAALLSAWRTWVRRCMGPRIPLMALTERHGLWVLSVRDVK